MRKISEVLHLRDSTETGPIKLLPRQKMCLLLKLQPPLDEVNHEVIRAQLSVKVLNNEYDTFAVDLYGERRKLIPSSIVRLKELPRMLQDRIVAARTMVEKSKSLPTIGPPEIINSSWAAELTDASIDGEKSH